jgi:hypothetical protein
MINPLSSIVVLIAVLGCTEGASNDRATVPNTAAHLTGSWDATFYLDREFRTGTSTLRRVDGTLVLMQIQSRAPSFPDMTAPLQYGLYDIDFSPYGFDPRDDSSVPTAVARAIPAGDRGTDSVFIILEPQRKGMTVLMRGEMSGDRGAGLWTVESPSRAGIAKSGRFSMTRQHISRIK